MPSKTISLPGSPNCRLPHPNFGFQFGIAKKSFNILNFNMLVDWEKRVVLVWIRLWSRSDGRQVIVRSTIGKSYKRYNLHFKIQTLRFFYYSLPFRFSNFQLNLQPRHSIALSIFRVWSSSKFCFHRTSTREVTFGEACKLKSMARIWPHIRFFVERTLFFHRF